MASAVSGVRIQSVRGFQILDSRNTPTVACRMRLTDGKEVWFKVPSGASTGEKEALEMRDTKLVAWRRKGVTQAVKNINGNIAVQVEGIPVEFMSQEKFDKILIDLDGTEYKSKLGANAILPVSGAYARALAAVNNMTLWEHFTEGNSFAMPVPMFNVFNGGKHADSGSEVQEIMVVPVGAQSFGEALEMGTGTWYKLKALLKKAGFSTGRGDEGGFVNPFRYVKDAVEAVLRSIDEAGYTPGKHVFIAFDGAFSEIFGKDLHEEKADPKDRTYHLEGKKQSPLEVVAYWERLVSAYPAIISIEDGMGERDAKGWKALTEKLGYKVQLVLDDYVCTNPALIRTSIRAGIGNSSLIKLNQVGTVTETIKAMQITRDAGRSNVLSHRSGETEDDFIGHFAVHPLVDQLKTGSSGADRNAKYNALWVIEQDYAQMHDGVLPPYRGLDAFPLAVREAVRSRK